MGREAGGRVSGEGGRRAGNWEGARREGGAGGRVSGDGGGREGKWGGREAEG